MADAQAQAQAQAHQQQQEDDISELFSALHQRMVQSGDWNRILGILRRMLEDCGYEEALQTFATEQAREQERLQLGPLLAVLSPHAKGQSVRASTRRQGGTTVADMHAPARLRSVFLAETLPTHVREHIGALIRDFLDRNVEDA
ncbi:SAGA histone acetylase and TREX-2 complexes component [Tilletia horrida]|nr:SAGA histone acetylase and TREX-2 complexes component [Tilletia horrida]KAK0567517.1 SAGA histone acetylase and TREX-2 complexes component [Tilletia horrida]